MDQLYLTTDRHVLGRLIDATAPLCVRRDLEARLNSMAQNEDPHPAAHIGHPDIAKWEED